MTKNENSASCAQKQLGTNDYVDHHDWFSNDVASNMVLAFGSLERFFVNLKRFIPYEDVVELRDKFSDMLFQKSVELSRTAKPFTPSNYSETTRALHRVTLHLRDGQTVQSDFLSPTEERCFFREYIGLYDSAVSEVYECVGAVKFTGEGVETVPIRTEALRGALTVIRKYGDSEMTNCEQKQSGSPERPLMWHHCEDQLPAVGLPLIVKITDGNHRVCVHHGDGLYWDLFGGRYLKGASECPTDLVYCAHVANFLDGKDFIKVIRDGVLSNV